MYKRFKRIKRYERYKRCFVSKILTYPKLGIESVDRISINKMYHSLTYKFFLSIFCIIIHH